MIKATDISERLTAIFLFGVLLFNPPFLSIFDHVSLVGGLPLLYAYLFAAWAVLIILVAVVIQGVKSQDDENDVKPPFYVPPRDRVSGTGGRIFKA